MTAVVTLNRTEPIANSLVALRAGANRACSAIFPYVTSFRTSASLTKLTRIVDDSSHGDRTCHTMLGVAQVLQV